MSKPPTPAQTAARERNFKIFRLRGLWEQTWLLTGDNRDRARAAIDAELSVLGAITQTENHKRARLNADAARLEREGIPF